MLKSRVMRPGLATNEVLASLGPYAEILFTRLWMLADREGRLEDRPARIKAEAMPYYDVDVENLLESLHETGFIVRYKVRNVSYIAIHSFRKHQPVHPHEAKSVIPAPPVRIRKCRTSQSDKLVPNVITCNGDAVTCHALITSTYTSTIGGVEDRGCGGKEPGEENPPPKSSTPTQPPAAVKRKPPAREQSPGPRRERSPVHRSPTSTERPVSRAAPIDWSPHHPADVATVRESLKNLAIQTRMPAPDDGIVRQVLDGAYGASGIAIHQVLRNLWLRHRFRSMYSWGFVPMMVRQCFQAA